jgi:hypothetical protein
MVQLPFGLLLSLITVCNGNKQFGINNNEKFIVKNHEKSRKNGIDYDASTNMIHREPNEIDCDVDELAHSHCSNTVNMDINVYINNDLNNDVNEDNESKYIHRSNNINIDNINAELDNNINNNNKESVMKKFNMNTRIANMNTCIHREKIVISAKVEKIDKAVISNKTSLFSRYKCIKQ